MSRNQTTQSMVLLPLGLAFVVLFAGTSYGQAVKKDTSASKWVVGVDLLWLINKNQLPPMNFQVKRLLKQTEHGQLYARLRVGFDYKNADSTNFTGAPLPGPYNETWLNYFVRVGVEKQKQLTTKWLYYYGADVGFAAANYDYEKTRLYYPGAIFFFDKGYQDKYGYSLIGLAGIRYKLNDWVDLSLESSIAFSIVKHVNYNTNYSFPIPSISDNVDRSTSNQTINQFIPIQFLNINLKLK